jgi:hypothetical protein
VIPSAKLPDTKKDTSKATENPGFTLSCKAVYVAVPPEKKATLDVLIAGVPCCVVVQKASDDSVHSGKSTSGRISCVTAAPVGMQENVAAVGIATTDEPTAFVHVPVAQEVAETTLGSGMNPAAHVILMGTTPMASPR